MSTRPPTSRQVEQLTKKYIKFMETRVESLKEQRDGMKKIVDIFQKTSFTILKHECTQLLDNEFKKITKSTIEFLEFLKKEIPTENSEISQFSPQKLNFLIQKARSAATTVKTIYEEAKKIKQGVLQDSEGGGGVTRTTTKRRPTSTGKTRKPKGNVHQQGQSPMLGMFFVVVGVAAIALTFGFQ